MRPLGPLLAALTPRRLAIAGAVVLGGLGLWGVLWAWQASNESRGLVALAEARLLAREAQRSSAPEVRDRAAQALEAVVTGYPGLSAAAQAAYMLGNLRYEARQYAQARGAYELALAKRAEGAVKSLAAVGIGYAWESEGNYASAAAAFESALRGLGPKDFLYEEGLLALARAQELGGKPEAAIESLKRLVKEAAGSPREDEARLRLARLLSRPGR